jgi:hypothetical protein
MRGRRLDLIGQLFEKLTVVRFSHVNKKNHQSYWVVICSCGNKEELIVSSNLLTQKKKRSCGCLYKEKASKMFPGRTHGKSHNFIDLSDQQFTRFKVLGYGGRNRDGDILWKCECSCPDKTIKYVLTDRLTSGQAKSCGCLVKEGRSLLGFSKSKDPIEVKFAITYKGMISRCYNPNDISYSNYGGRGIIVCDRWLGKEGFKNYKEDRFGSFIQHINEFGLRNTTNERIDVDKDYCLENVGWATYPEQGKNKQDSPLTKDLKLWKEVRKVYAALRAAIIRNSHSSIYESLLGCSIQETRNHLESQFIEDMSWETYGYGEDKWEIDHIKSLHLFDFSQEDSWLSAFHFTNQRPFRRSQNASKR